MFWLRNKDINFQLIHTLIWRPGPCQVSLTLSLLMVTCHLLIAFANSLDPDQDNQNVSPDLDPNCLLRFSVAS